MAAPATRTSIRATSASTTRALGTPLLGEPLSSTPQSPADHVGPGRGEQGSEFTAQGGAGSEPDAEDLQVEVDDGVVALTGDVDDPAVSERAEQIAAAVSGVQSVTNQIRVRRGEDEG
jgi:hypothetical protein